MEIFTNKRKWQKIVIILLLILCFQFIASTPVHAGTGVLLEPITNLLAKLGDGIMNIMQKTFMDMEASGVWIDEANSKMWLTILIIATVLMVVTVAVTALFTAGMSLTILCTAAGVIIKAVGCGAVAFFAVNYVNLGNKGFFLPEYHLTPQAIFKNEILAFDVNFFNPREPELKKESNDSNIISLNYKTETEKTTAYKLKTEEYEEFKSKYGFFDDKTGKTVKFTGKQCVYNSKKQQPDGSYKGYDFTLSEREWTHNGKTYRMYYEHRKPGFTDFYYLKDLRIVSGGETEKSYNTSLPYQLQVTVSAWYKTFRDIAIVALLSVLVYIGIRITLSSVASDKAKYKQMLGDWVVALCLVFIMHYIMSFACAINEKIIDALDAIEITTYGGEQGVLGDSETPTEVKTKQKEGENGDQATNEEIQGSGVEVFILTGENAELARKQLVGQDDAVKNDKGESVSGKDSTYNNRFSEDGKTLYWPVNDFMAQARIKAQEIEVNDKNKEINGNQTAVARAGYNIIYVTLVLYTVYFCYVYLRRVVYMAFLTMIAPLVAITYPIDKINDGKAQAFDLWLKEYIFNLLMQPIHLILYIVLIGSAMKFAATNIFYVVVALAFLLPAEKLIRRFFGFEKSQTAGTFGAGAAMGTGLMMAGLSKLKTPKSSAGQLGEGKEEDNKEEEVKIRDKDFDEIDALINEKVDPENNNDKKSDEVKYHPMLTKEQIDELKEEGLEPGDQEYNQYLLNHGIKPDKSNKPLENPNKTNSNYKNYNLIKPTNSPNKTNNNYTNYNLSRPDTNINLQSGKKKKLVRPRRAARRGLEHYGEGLKKRYIAKGGIRGSIRRGIRMAGGIATGAVAATAGGIIGITTGDASKALQYATTGAVGGYALGKSGVDTIANKIEVPGTIEAVKQGYYGDEYKEKQEEKYKKEFIKDNVNLRKIEDKFNVNRKEAKEIMEKEMKYYLDEGMTNMDEIMATYRTEKELKISKKQALATQRCAKHIAKGKDTRYLSSKEQGELEDTLRDKFKARGSKNVEEDVKIAMRNLDTYNKFIN